MVEENQENEAWDAGAPPVNGEFCPRAELVRLKFAHTHVSIQKPRASYHQNIDDDTESR